jgi:hypothetical protein
MSKARAEIDVTHHGCAKFRREEIVAHRVLAARSSTRP